MTARKIAVLAVILVCIFLAGPHSASAQLPAQGGASNTFSETCATCHGNASVPRAPAIDKLRQMTPEAIYGAMTTGAMRIQAQGLSDAMKIAVTQFLTGRRPGVASQGDAAQMPNQCASHPPLDLEHSPAWNGWSPELSNARFQPAKSAQLTLGNLPRLKLKWAFGLPGATVVYSQPTIAGGRVFVGADTGYVYSIDEKSGCVYWSYAATAGVRSAIRVGEISTASGKIPVAFFGDVQANVYALNALTGNLIWKSNVETHPAARITGSPVFYKNRLYVPVASMEEGAGGSPGYPCCSFRGSVSALNAGTGKQIWKTYTITEPLKPIRTNARGVQLVGPSGGGVWDSPTIDPKKNALYIGTGDAYSPPAPKNTDAIMAMDLTTGKILWSMQDTSGDVWITNCWPPKLSENCPTPVGPDADFGASPILRELPGGQRLLIAGQKSGIVWAHDPEKSGALVWKQDVTNGPASDNGQITWGGAADDQNAYFGLHSGGIVALHLADGMKRWFAPLPPSESMKEHVGQNGPVSAIPGVVFSGGWDGVLRAISAEDGSVLWEYNTVKDYDAVNHVATKGGSIGATGPVVAGGMVFVGSGFIGVQNGVPGNALLAFTAE